MTALTTIAPFGAECVGWDVDALFVPPPRVGRDDVAAAVAQLAQRAGQQWNDFTTAWIYGRPAPGRCSTCGQLLEDPGDTRTHVSCPSGRMVGEGVRDGLTFLLTAHVGGVRLSCKGLAAAAAREATEERPGTQELKLRAALDKLSKQAARQGIVYGTKFRTITEWSKRSRARMVEALAATDWSGLDVPDTLPGMVTLTYPGEWENVVPRGDVAKRHLEAFKESWRRDLGWSIRGAWKLEFQRRGAPHFHLLVPIPMEVKGEKFPIWLSRTWARIVGAKGDEKIRHLAAGTAVDMYAAGRMIDPKRTAVYFLKHGSKNLDDKEYQHIVPYLWRVRGAGPGRFWGIWGQSGDNPPCPRTSVTVAIDLDDYLTIRRILRRAARARARGIAYRQARRDGKDRGLSGAALVRHAVGARAPAIRTLGAGGRMTGGWHLSSDGVALVLDIRRALALRHLP